MCPSNVIFTTCLGFVLAALSAFATAGDLDRQKADVISLYAANQEAKTPAGDPSAKSSTDVAKSTVIARDGKEMDRGTVDAATEESPTHALERAMSEIIARHAAEVNSEVVRAPHQGGATPQASSPPRP